MRLPPARACTPRPGAIRPSKARGWPLARPPVFKHSQASESRKHCFLASLAFSSSSSPPTTQISSRQRVKVSGANGRSGPQKALPFCRVHGPGPGPGCSILSHLLTLSQSCVCVSSNYSPQINRSHCFAAVLHSAQCAMRTFFHSLRRACEPARLRLGKLTRTHAPRC